MADKPTLFSTESMLNADSLSFLIVNLRNAVTHKVVATVILSVFLVLYELANSLLYCLLSLPGLLRT